MEFKLLKLHLFIRWCTINLRFVSPTYRSLAIVSCLAVLTLCDLLFSLHTCPDSVIHSKSYLLQSYKTLIFANAANCTRVILLGIASGLNLTYLVHSVRLLLRVRLSVAGLVVKINAILFSGNNNVHYLLCLRCHILYSAARQEDRTLINLVATLGSIGVGVLVSNS